MRTEIENEDIKVLEKLAKKYDMSIVDFGKAIVSQTKKYNQRMFRVSESEHKEIAKESGKGRNESHAVLRVFLYRISER